MRVALRVLLLLSPVLLMRADDARLAQIERESDAALARHDLEGAVALLELGLRIDSGWRSGLWKAGMSLYQLERYREARRHLERLVELDTKAGAPSALLGLCEMELGEYPRAGDHLRRGLALGIPAQLGLAEVAQFQYAIARIMLEQYESALGALHVFVETGQHTDELVLALGLAALHLRALPREAARALPPERLAVVRQVGEAHYQGILRDDVEVDKIYRTLLETAGNLPGLHYSYAILLLDRGDPDRAESQLREELRVSPKSVPARIGLAYLGLGTGKEDRFLPFAREAVKLSPSSYLAHLYLGRLLLGARKAEQAVYELEISRDLAPQNKRARHALAQAYRSLGQAEKAAREEEELKRLEALR